MSVQGEIYKSYEDATQHNNYHAAGGMYNHAMRQQQVQSFNHFHREQQNGFGAAGRLQGNVQVLGVFPRALATATHLSQQQAGTTKKKTFAPPTSAYVALFLTRSLREKRSESHVQISLTSSIFLLFPPASSPPIPLTPLLSFSLSQVLASE